jgi:prepilin-type processing-associated H-X9-DG protein
LALYVADHEAYPPSESGSFTNVIHWYDLLNLPLPRVTTLLQRDSGMFQYPHLGGVFKCPLNAGYDSSGTDQKGNSYQRSRIPWTCYGYNAWGVGQWNHDLGLGGVAPLTISFGQLVIPTRATRDASISKPSDMIAIGDAYIRSTSSLDGGLSDSGTFGPRSSVHGVIGSTVPYKKQAGFVRHRGRFNRLFCDAHIEREDLNRKFNRTESYMRRWNKDNEPHPEVWE